MDAPVTRQEVSPFAESSSGTPSSAPSILKPGDEVGRYRVLARLGQGGMATVFSAFDPDLGRNIALKLLHVDSDDHRLEREARALASVSHPNVIAVYDVGHFMGRLFVAMELVEGVTLRRWLDQAEDAGREPSLAAIMDIFLQAGRGLVAAHERGLVHRDFKPENVMVGNDGRVRVLDFGLVGAQSRHADSSSAPEVDARASSPLGLLTETGKVLGTPAYMALEQYSSAPPDARTDQFSYCVALWEAICGQRPFDADSILELLGRLKSGAAPQMAADSRRMPFWLEGLLRRGLSHQPDARFASMSELLAHLEAGLERAREEEQLIGRRYRPLGPRSSAWLRAIDTFTEQQVFLSQSEQPLQFERLSSLDHPNIVRVLDLAWTPGRDAAYLVLDLSQPGRELAEAARGAPLGLVLEWLSELLRALYYLHRHRFGHRAFTPRDVTLVAGRLKLLVLESAEFRGRDSVAEDLRFVAQLLDSLPGLPSALSRLAAKLRARSDEYGDARQLLSAIAQASERELNIETVETRESFLRTMPLLGRQQVLAELCEALGALPAGRGAAFWIEGESGVGKSRLLEEVRRFALARGVLVLEGREEANAPSPYQVFRLPLFRLGLRTSSAVLEDYQLAALSSLIPELRSRLGRASSTSGPDGAASDALNAVALTLVRQQREPLLLILEDMQWSGSESLRLLADLVALCESYPIMILASCRSEDGARRVTAPPGMRHITLERLAAATVSELCAGLTGAGRLRADDLPQLLVRETEGNPFFLVEALRALAEDAGSLDDVPRAALPARIFAGGIQAAVQRRLAAVPSAARPLLHAAAVLGRGVDTAVLKALRPEVDIERWLEDCVMAAVLERVEGGRDSAIRFRHDKLRDGLLAELAPEAQRKLHGEVAAAIERVHGDSATHWAALARHYRAAGNDAKEITFAARAARQALGTRATGEAAEFLTRALSLAERVARPDLLPWLHALGAELELQRQSWAASRAHVEAAFGCAGRPLWSWRLGGVFFLLAQLCVFLVRSALPKAPSNAPVRAGSNDALLYATEVLINVAHITGDSLLTLTGSLLTANISARGRCTSVSALLVLAVAAKAAGLRKAPRRLLARATTLLPVTTDRKELAEALNHYGLYSIGEGELERARQQLTIALEISTSIGYPLGCSWSQGQLAVCAHLEGRFEDMRACFERGARHSPPADPARVAAQAGQIIALVRLGRLDEARALHAAMAEVKPDVAPLPRAIHAAATALLLLESGQLPAALKAADLTLQILPWAVQVPAVCSEILTLPSEVYLQAWRLAEHDKSAVLARARRLARRRIEALSGWARLHPVAEPMADYYSARALELAGHRDAARTRFERAAEGARSLGLGYYERAASEALATLNRARVNSPI